MPTFQVKVEDIIGATGDTIALSDWLTAGAKFISDVVSEDKLIQYQSTIVDPDGSTGISIIGYRVIRAHKAGYRANIVDAGYNAQLADSKSIYFAVNTDPRCYLENGKGYVLPGGGSIIVYAYPSVAFGDTAIANFPLELEHGVVLFACIRGRFRQLTDLIKTTMDGVVISLPSAPSTPLAPSFVYTDAAVGSIAQTTLSALITAPTYTKPSVSLTTAPLDLAITATVPSAPSVPSFTAISISGVTTTATTVSALGTAPVYNAVLPTPIADVTVSATAPTALTAPSFTYADAINVDSVIPTLVDLSAQYTTLATDLDTNRDIELAQAKMQEIQTRIKEFESEASEVSKTLIQNASRETDLNKQNAIQNLLKDVQEYAAKVDRYKAELGVYNGSIQIAIQEHNTNVDSYAKEAQVVLQDELNEFNEANAVYQADLKQKIEQARHTAEKNLLDSKNTQDATIQNARVKLAKEHEEYADSLGKFSNEIKNYQAEIQEAVAIYSNNLQKWQTQRANELQQYSLDIQNELNEFNKEVVAYQTDLKHKIEQSELDAKRLAQVAQMTTDLNLQNESRTLEKQVTEYKSTLDKFSNDVNSYNVGVNAEISRVTTLINKYNIEHSSLQSSITILRNELNDFLDLYRERKVNVNFAENIRGNPTSIS